MNPLFLIPIILMTIGVIFMVFMNKKYKSVKHEINLDFERAKYKLHKQTLLKKDFSKLNKWMKGKPIDSFTSASIPQSTSSKLQELIEDGITNAALSVISIKLKRIETDSFWVLSGNNLHFLSTNEVGELAEHLVFDNFRIEKATLKYTGVLKSKLGIYSEISEEFLPKTHQINFNIDGNLLSLEIHDRLNYTPNPKDILNLTKQLHTRAKYQVVGEKFVSILQERFPHLKTK